MEYFIIMALVLIPYSFLFFRRPRMSISLKLAFVSIIELLLLVILVITSQMVDENGYIISILLIFNYCVWICIIVNILVILLIRIF